MDRANRLRCCPALALVAAALLGLPLDCSAAVTLLSALPSLGRATDIRDTGAIVSTAAQWTVYQSLSYRFADQKFGPDGRVSPLGLNQTITLASAPTSVSYGVSDRLALGLTFAGWNRVRRTLSLTNFADGATLLGQTLPTGQSTRLVQKGDGAGDWTLNGQFRLSRAGQALSRFVSLDVTVPTAGSDPSGPLELPIGQGYYGATPSFGANLSDGSWTHSAKLGYEWTSELVSRDFAGVKTVTLPGRGFNFSVGSGFRLHGGVTARAHLTGFQRDAPEDNGVERPERQLRSLELRPGLTIHGPRVRWNVDTFVPLSGANVLRSTGLFATAEVTF